MAEQETTAVSHELESTRPVPASRADAVAAIDDTLVRRFVRVALHVRGYAPYYVATLALFGFLAFGPRPDGTSGDDSPFGTSAASATGGGTAAGGAGGGRAAGGSTTSLSPQAAGTLLAGAAGLDGLAATTDTSTDGTFSVAGDAAAPGATLPEAPGAPGAPSVDDVDPNDVDYGRDLPDTCTVSLPSPAPSVSPSREVSGAQTTLEAAAGMEFPADAAPYAEDAASAAGCPDVESVPIPIPAVPGLPV